MAVPRQPMPEGGWPAGVVTVMFTDIVDSTRLKGAMDGKTAARRDEAYRERVKVPHDRRLLDRVHRSRGFNVKSTGDGFLFVFGDVEEAVLCGIDLQESLRVDPISTPLGELQVRIGLHTGPAVRVDADYTGATVDKAARVCATAPPGEVLVSDETRHMASGVQGITFTAEPPTNLKGIGPTLLHRVAQEPSVVRHAAPPGVHLRPLADLTNPYDFAATARKATFKGRALEAEELATLIQTSTHTAIFGLQRMGKTSLIEYGLENELRRHPELAKTILIAKVDMQRIGGAQVTYREFAHTIVSAIVAQLNQMGLGREVANLKALTTQLFDTDQYERGADRSEFFSLFSRVLLRLATVSQRRIVLFIDEFSEIRKVIERNDEAMRRNPGRIGKLLPHDLYIDQPFMRLLSSLLRDDAFKSQVTLVLLVRPFLAEYDERENLQVLKLMIPIVLRHLDVAAAKELITEPLREWLTFEDGVVEYLVRLTAGHPYLLQFILKQVVDRIKRHGVPAFSLADVKAIETKMIEDGPAYDAQFAVLVSDYSVDEVTMPQEARLGKGVLALVSKFGQDNDGWVLERQISDECARHKIPDEKTKSILSQLVRTCILEESGIDDETTYRVAIPLVRERFVRQNLYQRFFHR